MSSVLRDILQKASDWWEASARLGASLTDFAKWEEAKIHLVEARRLAKTEPEIAMCKKKLGEYWLGQMDYPKAENHFRKALDIRTRCFEPEDPEVLISMSDVATAIANYDAPGAEQLYRGCLEIQQRTLGIKSPHTLHSMCRLGTTLVTMRNFQEGAELLERAYEVYREISGKESSDTVSCLLRLAHLYETSGDSKRAESHSLTALEIRKRSLEPRHPDTLSAMSRLGVHFYNQKAEPILRESTDTANQVLGENHNSSLRCSSNLGLLLANTGRFNEAKSTLQKALAISVPKLGTNHEISLDTSLALGMALTKGGEYEEAEPILTQCLETFREQFGRDAPKTLAASTNLGILFYETDRLNLAEPLFRRSFEITEQNFSPDHTKLLTELNNLGKCLCNLDKMRKARTFYFGLSRLHANNLPHFIPFPVRPERLRRVNRITGRQPQRFRSTRIDSLRLSGIRHDFPRSIVAGIFIEHATKKRIIEVIWTLRNHRLILPNEQNHLVEVEVENLPRTVKSCQRSHGSRCIHIVGSKSLENLAVVYHGFPIMWVEPMQLTNILPETPHLKTVTTQ